MEEAALAGTLWSSASSHRPSVWRERRKGVRTEREDKHKICFLNSRRCDEFVFQRLRKQKSCRETIAFHT